MTQIDVDLRKTQKKLVNSVIITGIFAGIISYLIASKGTEWQYGFIAVCTIFSILLIFKICTNNERKKFRYDNPVTKDDLKLNRTALFLILCGAIILLDLENQSIIVVIVGLILFICYFRIKNIIECIKNRHRDVYEITFTTDRGEFKKLSYNPYDKDEVKKIIMSTDYRITEYNVNAIVKTENTYNIIRKGSIKNE